MAGSGRPESKQVKVVGSAAHHQNVEYFNQQSDAALPGPTMRHPNAVTTLVSNQQQQPVADKDGQ
jgi:hypothetical protein